MSIQKSRDVLSKAYSADPKPAERDYFRHKRTGELGWLVVRDGKKVIRLDRGNVEELRPFMASEWFVVDAPKRLSQHQVAKAAWLADRSLLMSLGRPLEARKDWESLAPKDRWDFANMGPDDPDAPERRVLWDSIIGALSIYASD